MDEYNNRDNITTSNPSDTYIETPSINCTGVSSVVVKFSQYFRLCCRSYNLEMLVSSNGGNTWATYDARFNVMGNTFTPEKFRRVEINISDVAAGFSDVRIRFYMHGPSNYFWMIDDLMLVEAYQNNLVLEDYWLDFDSGLGTTIGQINYWPKTQLGQPGEITGTVGNQHIKAALLNNGMSSAENSKLTVQILQNGLPIHSDQSTGKTINSLSRDTFALPSPWLPTAYGDYRIDYKAIFNQPDEVPQNNAASLFFTINDTLAHRADFSAESSSNTAGWIGGDNAGDMVGVLYTLFAPAEIKSITAFLTGYEPLKAPQFQFILFKQENNDYVEWISSTVQSMDSSFHNRFVTLPVQKDGESEYLQPGKYATCVKMWANDPADPARGSNGMTVGWDMSTKPSNTLLYQSIDGFWYPSDKLNLIGMVIQRNGGVTKAPVTFNVNMNHHIASGEFKPGRDFIDISGSFNYWEGSSPLSDPDADGIYSITIEGITIATLIEYKYRINGNETTSEFSSGEPKRKYTVRYWNVLNDVYNGGKISGLFSEDLLDTFMAYPNPAQQAITVEIRTSKPANIILKLTNIQGQEIYHNTILNTHSHLETINRQLPKGIYLLSVDYGSGIRIKKIIIN
jgi:hypothetical protein